MATYSNNTTIKIDSKTSGQTNIASNGTSTTIFTVPANSYAIVNFHFNATFASNAYPAYGLVDDRIVCTIYSTLSAPSPGEKPPQVVNLFVGPGSTFKIKNGYTVGGSQNFDWSYVLFSNTP